jgi:hypothetical protein
MKKRITTSFIFILLFSFVSISFAQDTNDKNYSVIKENFYKKYLIYKSNLDNGIATTKPIDPSGLFVIDNKNNFIPAENTNEKASDMYSQAPWINGTPDVISGHIWTQPAGTYTTITGGAGTVAITTIGVDDNSYGALPIGFTFNFDDVDYTQFGLNANGWISMGSGVPSNSYTPISTGITRNIISAMAADLLGQATGRIEYQTSGTAPNRVLTIQWSTWAFYNGGVVDGSTLNFQIKLFETSNNIQLIYGTNTQSAINHTVQVGLGGAATTDFNNRTTTTNWSATTAGTLNSDACTMTTTIVPALNLTFQWAPPAPSPMVYVSSTSAQIQNGANTFQGSANNNIIQVQVVMAGTLTPLNMTNMAFNTTGTTNPSLDIANAKVYYTGTTNVFSTATQFGSTVPSPSGAFSVTGTQVLSQGTNYFWLTYDVPAGGPIGDYLDAQVTTITGSGSMGVQTPTITNPDGNRQIDNYCRGTFSNNGCLGTGIYISNFAINTINNASGCDPGLNFPINYSWFGNLSTTLEQGSTYPVSATTFSSSNAQGFALWIDWNNNDVFTDPGEYYAFPFISSGSSTTTTLNLTVPPSAPLGNHRIRVRNNFNSIPTAADVCTNLSYGETEDYTINVTAASPMTYTSSTTTQTVTSGINAPLTNAQMIGIQVLMSGTLSPVNVTSFTLNTNGSTNPAADISNAKLWYTGTSSVFSTTTQYGYAFISPNGAFNITGTLQLAQGTNYFWLTYDVPSNATSGNFLDAECNSITIASIPRIPTVTAPAGNRLIGGSSLSGNYTIPGSYATIAAAISDINARGVNGLSPVTFTVADGYTETAVNLTLTRGGTQAGPIIFKKGAAGPDANPIITAGTGTGTTDGIIKFSGVSYVTFDGIDLQENPGNTDNITRMEWGYALVKPNGTQGSQYITIKNCNITLNKENTSSAAIYSGNHSPTSTSTFIVSNVAGANSYNAFQNNTITNAYIGVFIQGYIDAAPFAFYDQNNTVDGNNITNYGGTSVTAYGIYNIYQNNLVLNNNIINSSGGTNSTGTLYGIFSSTMSNSSLTISNNTVTLVSAATTSSVFGINFGNGSVGTSNTINVINNTVQNCSYATATSGAMNYIYCNATSNILNVEGNRVIGNTYGNATSTGTVNYIYNLNAAVTSISLVNNLDSGNTIYGTTANGSFHISSQATTNNLTVTGNRIKNDTLCGTTSTATNYGIFVTGATLTSDVSNNTVSNNTALSTGSHVFFGINIGVPAPTSTCSNNLVSGNSSRSTGIFSGITYTGAPGLGSEVNITNNTVTNQQKLTVTGTGIMYGIHNSGSGGGTYNFNNNIVEGLSSEAASPIYGIYQIGSPANFININNNRIGNLSNNGVASIWGINNFPSSTSRITISGDSIYNFTSAGGTLFGILMNSGGSWDVFNNKISGITSNTGTTAVVSGIHSTVSVASNLNIYNNFISDLNATASTSIAPAVAGVNIASGSSTTNVNLFYNTIYLNAVSSSATTFGTAGIYALTTPAVTLSNNVVVNNSTPGPTGGNTAAYRRSSTTLTTYGSTSNNNCFYSGTPSTVRLLYFDGINSDQTIAALKTRLIPRDNVSVSELPPFVNAATTPYNLRIQTTTPTQLESGGKVISTPLSITSDNFGTARFPNTGYPVGGFTPVAPDIGAHEFGGLNADNVPPSITYTALGTGGTGNRAFSNVIITDASGVNTTVGTRPRCYYKRSTDGNVINDNTSGTDGWKYVESNGAVSPFDFTINYSLLNGGTGVIAGNTIQYFVVAQDLAGTPNIGQNQAIFATAPASVALVAGNAPITSTLSYLIGTNTFSGAINVGTAQPFTSLTGAGGLFASINAGVVSGNITANITSDLTEDGSNQLNAFNETGPGGYTLTIIPATASMKTISGTVANGMIRFNGSRRVIIDGNGGLADNVLNLSGNNRAGTKYLTFRNINTANPTFTFINDAIGNTITNCIIESNNAGTASGSILFSTTTGTQGNDSNLIKDCDIRDRSDLAGTYANGIYSSGTTTTLNHYNNFNRIIGCNVYNYFVNTASTTAGIFLTSGSSDWTVDSCSFYQTVARDVTVSATYIGVYSASTLNMGLVVTNNYFGGSAPQCGGSALTYTGTGLYTYNGIQLLVGGLFPSSVQGNTVQNINLTTSPASGSSVLFRGITVPTSLANVNIGNVTGNTIGSPTGNGSITLNINTTTSSYISLAGIFSNAIGNISNNRIGSITVTGNSAKTSSSQLFLLQWSSTIAGWNYICNNNLIGSLSTPNSVLYNDTLSPAQVRPIFFQNGIGTNNIITNNTIANITNNTPATTFNTAASLIYGVSGSTGNHNISNNNIFNLTLNTNTILPTTFLLSAVSHSSTGINNINQNTISSLYFNAFSTGVGLNAGMFIGGATGSTISRNKISDSRYNGTATTTSTLISGIFVANATPGTINVTNNMVTLTNGDLSDIPYARTQEAANLKHDVTGKNLFPLQSVPAEVLMKNQNPKIGFDPDVKEIPADVQTCMPFDAIKYKNDKSRETLQNNQEALVGASIVGMISQSASNAPTNFYYNSVYVGGSQPGSSAYNSWAFLKQFNGAISLRNNLFVNARTGGSATHIAISNQSTNLLAGWPSNASNYNVIISVNSSAISEWGAGNPQTIAQWVALSGGDKNSWGTNTSTLNPSNLLTSVSTGDLTILSGNTAAWIVSGKGLALTGQNIDYTGDTRFTLISGGCTDIGADEFTATPPSNPVATQVGTPGAGNTTNYVLWGRTICSIDWGTGGSSYPANLNVNYFSGVNPSPAITSPNRNSNSYWVVAPSSGTLTGATYSITLNFGDNETFNITSPNTNTLLARYNTFWQVYPSGSGNQFSSLNWNDLTLKTSGLNSFSTFALSDAALPSIELVTPPNDTIIQISTTTLVWKKAAGSTMHRVVLATDSTFATGIVKDTVTADTTKAISGLVLNSNYWWRVYGINGVGTGAYSQVFKFTYKILLTPPPPPVLSSPPNNATGQPIALNLVWLKAVTATSYRVMLATDSTFASGIIINDSTMTDSIRSVAGLNYSTNYFWRVNAKNSAGTSSYSPVWKFTTGPLPPALVNLTVIPGGFFNSGTGRLNMKDTVTVYLVDSTTCLKVDSNKVVIDSVNFSAPLSFSNAPTGNYYILVYHRNHLGVASRFRQTITRGSSVSYDFTTDSAKTFGFNAVKVSTSPVRWAMISGDANRDGFVDGLDQTIWIGQNGFDGYLSADFNGDSFVDGLDQTIWIIFNGNGSFLPCGFFLDPFSDRIQLNTPDHDAKRSNMIIFDRKRKGEIDSKIDKNR